MSNDPLALTIPNVIRALARHVSALMEIQITDESDPACGGIIGPNTGTDEPQMTAPFIAACGLLYIAHRRGQELPLDPHLLLKRAEIGMDYLLRLRRPSGLLDLRNCNYDSPPDTGFAVQVLCPVMEMGKSLATSDRAWGAFLTDLESFLRPAAAGIMAGGFHTPNHRWVIASALVQAHALFPDIDVRTVVEAYLAEGFDVNAEGAFIERSVGVYDAVCERSLLLIAAHWDCPTALTAVRANLDFNLHLLHADGTAETGISRRQDYGTRVVAIHLAANYLASHFAEANPVFVTAAQMLFRQALSAEGTVHLPNGGGYIWLLRTLLAHGEPAPSRAELPSSFAQLYPLNGIWRARRGPLSATLFRGATRLLTFSYGRAELASLKISQSYFGTGRFVGDSLTWDGGSVILRSEGRAWPRRPGYELPLGRPVPADKFQEMIAERTYYPVQPCLSTLSVTEISDGLELHYKTLEGYDRVPAQIALDFAPGGIWETGDTCLQPQAGQVMFLKGGFGTMRYGSDGIRIGPGGDAHRAWQMRDAETAPAHVRVLLTFVTPVDATVTITGIRDIYR